MIALLAIGIPLVFILLLLFALTFVSLLVGFVRRMGRPRHECRRGAGGVLSIIAVLGIAAFLMVSLFTVRVSHQENRATLARDVAIEAVRTDRHEAAARDAMQRERERLEAERHEAERHTATAISFSAREGAPPEPIELESPDAEATASTPSNSPYTILTVSADRPAWLGEAPRRVGPVFSTVVVSDPYVSKSECDTALDPQLRNVALGYVDDLLGSGARRFVDLDISDVRTRIARDEYVELLDTSVGPMQRVHVLLEFDESLRAEFRQRYKEGIRQRRLYQASGGAMLFLALLGVVFGYLTIDTATRGFYSRRLQLAATVAILLIVFAGFALNRAI